VLCQVIIVPILAGLSGRGVQPLTWFSAVAALFGVSLLEGGGSPPCLGDMWSFISALAFGVQVRRCACCACSARLAAYKPCVLSSLDQVLREPYFRAINTPYPPCSPPSPLQVFRTEHWARTLGPKRALPLMSVVLAVTMACSLGAAVVAHPDAALDLLQHPWLMQHLLQDGHFPWSAALYTGLMTTDVCLLLEVRCCKAKIAGLDECWAEGSGAVLGC
jgi:hypothetical protein